MKELITRPQADALIVSIGALGVIIAFAAFFIARQRGQNGPKYATLYGAPLLICAALWPLYNAIEDHFGLDSVVALAINGGIFVVLGAVLGIGWSAFFGKKNVSETE